MRLCCLPLLLALTRPAAASDHIDGVPSLELHDQVDLTDLYLFRTPGDPARLTLILNLYPGVEDDGHFSSKVSYRVRLRTLTRGGDESAPRLPHDPSSELEIVCDFIDPDHGRAHGDDLGDARCTLSGQSGELAALAGPVGAPLSTASGAWEAYLGPRADPFFLNPTVFNEVVEREGFTRQEPGSASNVLGATNVLTVVMELEQALLFPDGGAPMIGVVAESFTTEGGQEEVLDRLGRGEVTNLSLHDYSDSEPLKRGYNALPGFQAPAGEHRATLEARLRDNIRAYDTYDGDTNWPEAQLDALVALLLDDYLVMDLSADCGEPGPAFLTIERALLLTGEPAGCGGRRLPDDVFASMYALYIGGPAAPISAYETGVSAPYQGSDKQLSDALPYLDVPYATCTLRPNLRRFLLNHVLKRDQD